MGLSDSVLAAMIGAGATIGTALFQLIHNWRAQASSDRKTKRGGFRSLMMLLVNTASDYAPRPDHRPLTKFEQRGRRLGHGVWDLLYRRVAA